MVAEGLRLALGLRLLIPGTTFLSDAADQVEIAIVRYLLERPEALDTAEGIQRWWLPPSGQYSSEAVKTALERLTSRNLLSVWSSPSTKPVYGLPSSQRDALEAYLRKIESVARED